MWERKLLCYPWLERNQIVPFPEKKTEALFRRWGKKNEIKTREWRISLKYGRNSCQDKLPNTGMGCKENLLGLPFLASSATGMDYTTCQNHFLVLCHCGFPLKLPTTTTKKGEKKKLTTSHILLCSISPQISHTQKMYIARGYSKCMLFVNIPSSKITF